MYNYDRLLARIISRYKNRFKFAQEIGISPTSLYNKLENKQDFKQGEIIKIAELLGIRDDEIMAYFFDYKVVKNASDENG